MNRCVLCGRCVRACNELKGAGVSFGRVHQRSDVLVKEALFAAKVAGAEVQFINTMRLNIGYCSGNINW